MVGDGILYIIKYTVVVELNSTFVFKAERCIETKQKLYIYSKNKNIYFSYFVEQSSALPPSTFAP